MLRMILAAAAAFALVASQPAFACPDCKDCPQHKAAADKAGKNDKAASCDCAKECKCAPNCGCTHCQKKAAPEKKDEKKT